MFWWSGILFVLLVCFITYWSITNQTKWLDLLFRTISNNISVISWWGPSWSWSYGSWIYIYLCNQNLSPLKLWVRIPVMYSIQHYVIELISDSREVGWFSLGTPVTSTNKTDRHDIAEILLQVALTTTCLTISRGKPFYSLKIVLYLKDTTKMFVIGKLLYVNWYQVCLSTVAAFISEFVFKIVSSIYVWKTSALHFFI